MTDACNNRSTLARSAVRLLLWGLIWLTAAAPVARAQQPAGLAESKLPRSHFAGTPISDRPFTAADVAAGRAIFLGTRGLANGGAPCISCHTVGTIDRLGGSRLGPDLTLVYERLGGRQGVGRWLGAPPAGTMQALFKGSALEPNEIFSLLAFFDDAGRRSQPASTASILNFFLIGFGATLLALAGLQAAWRGRFGAVRRRLVRAQQRGEE